MSPNRVFRSRWLIPVAFVSLVFGFGAQADTLVSGTISASTTWTLLPGPGNNGSPYVVTAPVFVAGTATPILTIEAGVTVKFRANTYVQVGTTNPGSLVAVGTSSLPILFTTDQGTVTAGYYYGMSLSSAAPSQVAYLTIEGAGKNSTQAAGLKVFAGNPTLDHITLRTNSYAGLSVAGGTPTVTNSTITGTTTGDAVGIDLYSPGKLTISGTAITNNAGAAISLRTGSSLAGGTAMTISGNVPNAIRYRSNTITTSETWKNFGVPYIPDTYVDVAGSPAPTLTIDPGVVVQFNAGTTYIGCGYGNPGRIVAVGTATQPILFTSNQATVTKGYWRGVFLGSASQPSSQLTYVTVEGAGLDAYSTRAAVTVEGGAAANPVLDHMTIRNNANSGLKVYTASPTVTNSLITDTSGNDGLGVDMYGGILTINGTSITNNAGAAIALRTGSSLAGGTGMTISGNVPNAIRYRSTTITTSETWKNFGVPYIPDTYVDVAGSPAPTLTISPGVVVRFNAGTTYIGCGYGNPGRIVAVGTAALPILFTSNQATVTKGYWRGVFLGSASQPSSQLTYVTVEGAGLDAYSTRAAVTVEGGAAANPVLDHMTIRNNANSGMKVWTASPTVTNSLITDTSGNDGLGVDVYSGKLTINSTSITNNAGAAMALYAAGAITNSTTLTITGNGINGIRYRSTALTSNQTWENLGVPYYLDSSLNVAGASTPVLTIEAGVTVKFRSGTLGNSVIDIGYQSPGKLVAVGTALKPITFTSDQPGAVTAGYWRGITFPSTAASSGRMVYCVVEGAGYDAYGLQTGIAVSASNPTFDHVTIRTSKGSGFRVDVGTPSITNSTITGTTLLDGLGVDVRGGKLTINSTSITDNAGAAMSLYAAGAITNSTALTITGNGINGVRYRSTTLASNQTWENLGVPYYLDSSLNVAGASTPVLTIEAGVTVKFRSGTLGNSVLDIGYQNPGKLVAVGTALKPITFTSDQTGAVTPGYWRGLTFPSTVATSGKMAYCIVEGAGYDAYGLQTGIAVSASNPTFDHVTIRTSKGSGFRVDAGTPSITNSTITGTTLLDALGIDARGGTLTLSSTAITNNTGAAISLRNGATFSGLTGVTATGNGMDAVRYRSTTIATSETWHSFGLPYIPDTGFNIAGASTPVLTIEPGVAVKFRSGTLGNMAIDIGYANPGRLVAVGTAAQPIRFTTDQATVTPGYWRGLFFSSTSTPSSQLTYVIVEGAGYNAYGWRTGVGVAAGSPAFDHVTLQNNGGPGMQVSAGTPTILNCAFVGNNAGLVNSTNPPKTLVANLNYWSAADGPNAGAGTGSGQSVSGPIVYEPWLVASPSQPQYFNAASERNRTFNPSIAVNTTFNFGTAQAGTWTLTLKNGSTVVRTITGSGATGTAVWNGKDGSTPPVDQPDGTYTYTLASTATAGGAVATVAQGRTILDRTKQLTISNLAVSPLFFSPNGDGVQDTTTVTGTNSFDDTTLTVNVKNSGATVVRTSSSSGLDLAYTWDGKNGTAPIVVQPDGVYTFEVVAVNGTATATSSATVTLDNTPPVAAISAPSDGQVLSNVYTNGVTNVTVTGSATDLNFKNWSLDYGAGATPTSFTALGSGTLPVTNVTMGTWATAPPFANGLYTLRLQAWDLAGNRSAVLIKPTVANFSVSQNVLQANTATSQTVTYASIVPFQLSETLVLKNASGQVARTLVNTARAAATYNDVWDGKNDSASLVPDGPYFYVATVTDGTHTFAWDLTNQYRNDYHEGHDGVNIQPYDPFNNQPMTFTYSFSGPGRVYIALTPGATTFPPAFYIVSGKYEESGSHTFSWAGIDPAGTYRGDITRLSLQSGRSDFSKNAVVVYGTKPVLTNLRVTPPVLGQGFGQSVTFNLSTYQSGTTNISVAYQNQASLSTLRTISLTGQPPGQQTIAWDGRADDGSLVAPGLYTVTASATDTIGNQVSSQILTTVRY